MIFSKSARNVVSIFLLFLNSSYLVLETGDHPSYLLCHIAKAFRLLIFTGNLLSYEQPINR